MDAEHLVQMVNDISDFYVPAVGPERAAAEVAGHLQRSWEARMRRQIVEHWRRGRTDLSETSSAAVAILAKALDTAA